MVKKPHLYLAGPLFSVAEREFNVKLKRLLEEFFVVYLPQDDGCLLVDLIKSGVSAEEAARRVFDADVKAMKDCDFLLIVLDGRSVDEGAAFELGFVHALGKVCVGLRTDPRQLLPSGNNPMVERPLSCLFGSVDELLSWAKRMS
ncbi:nucleoside 2-deoxyribosyltransferase [Candidatus Woesearchaeota archaeon]|nr:nucleoside 2-deoxyribosyltransferase [Candidatus Woesearchaeota archaeon]